MRRLWSRSRGVWPYAPTAPLAVLLLASCAAASDVAAPDVAAPAEELGPPPPVEARSAVDRAVATTGDVITYTVTVDYDPDYQAEVPEPGADIAGFRILDVGREPDRHAGDRVIEQRWYKLRADLVGSYVLPPVTVTYHPKEAEGEAAEPQTVQTSALFVEVESVLATAAAEGGEVSDIRDIKPLQPPASRVPWAWAGGGAAALLAAALAAFLLLRRRRQAQLPPVPPHERAFEALRALKGIDFSDREGVRRFHFQISEVVRAYVEGRFGLNATDLTREEILPRLPEIPELSPSDAASLSRFLTLTDRVKFAEHQPSEAEIEETWERALSFVEATRPREQETPPREEDSGTPAPLEERGGSREEETGAAVAVASGEAEELEVSHRETA